jgi:ABC-type multidrug transport system fused ATPase/permease subunit
VQARNPIAWTARPSHLLSLFGNRRAAVATLAASSVLSGFTESALLAIVAQVAAALVNGTTRISTYVGPVHLASGVNSLLELGLLLALVRLALQGLVSVLPARIAADLLTDWRSDLFSSFSSASWSVQSQDREGYLQEVATEQALQAVSATLHAASLITALLTFGVLVISALVLEFVPALIIIAATAMLFVLLRPLTAHGTRSADQFSQKSIEYAHGVSEAIRVAAETRVFGATSAQRNQIDRLLQEIRGPFFHAQLSARLGPALYQSLLYLFVIAGLWSLHAAGIGHVASLGAVILLLVRAGTYGQQVQSAYQYLLQTLPFFTRVQEAQAHYTASSKSYGDAPMPKVRTVTFENVSFSYGRDRPALQDVSFSVLGGETLGIIGPSGAGKSTLVQILLGLRSPTAGRYLINGVPADEVRREDWQRHVAVVPQEPRLLHASVAQNIRFFRELDDAAVSRAAELAGIHDEILTWEHGYETIVGPRADAVSGGQQQRLCLARALAAMPEVLVLDEPTSAVDPHSEARIQEALAALRHEVTIFIVAHRMAIVTICERVMVLVDGRLEAFDKPDVLRFSSSYFHGAMERAAGPRPSAPTASTR